MLLYLPMKVNFDNNYKFQSIIIKDLQKKVNHLPADELLIGGGDEGIISTIIDWVANFLHGLINCLFNIHPPDDLDSAEDEEIESPTPIQPPVNEIQQPASASSQAKKEISLTHLEELIKHVNTTKTAVRRNNPDSYDSRYYECYDQMFLFLKGITFELKKLEKEIENASPSFQQILKDKMRNYLLELDYGATKCTPGRYNETLRVYRKLSNCSETLYDRFLFFIQEIKEQFIWDSCSIEVHSFNTVRSLYGEDLGLNRNPIFLQDAMGSYKSLDFLKKLFNKSFTKDWLLELLVINVNNETDVNKHLYTEFMYNYLNNDPKYLAILDKEDWTQEEADAYTVQFQTKEGLTKKGIEAFFESVQDENGHKISDLFDPSGAIDWNIMKRVPKSINLEENTKNIPSSIQLDDLLKLWEKVK